MYKAVEPLIRNRRVSVQKAHKNIMGVHIRFQFSPVHSTRRVKRVRKRKQKRSEKFVYTKRDRPRTPARNVIPQEL